MSRLCILMTRHCVEVGWLTPHSGATGRRISPSIGCSATGARCCLYALARSHLRIIRSDARQRKRTSELQAAIDIGSGLIKAAGSAPTSAGAEQAPRVRFASSWYTTQEEVFSSHGSRSTYTTLNQVVVERGAMTQDRPYVYVPPIFCDVCVFVCM